VYGMLLVASVDVKQWYGRAWSIYVFELNRLLWLYAFLTFVVADLLYTYSSIQWRSYRSLLPLLSKQPNPIVTMESIPYLDNVD
jgi:Na+/melibiose symporter-like transporter